MDERSAHPRGRDDPHTPRLEAVATSRGGVRWLTRLDPADRLRYEAAVGPVVGRIERSLGPEVIANRARRAPGGWELVPWRPARSRWRRGLRRAVADAGPGTVFAAADVRECYGSITPGTISMLLGPEAAHAVAFLRSLEPHGVRGLPIGPDPSAVLANAALVTLDRSLRSAGVGYVRWVDDVILWGPDADVRRALDGVHRVAASLGFSLHDRKTRLLDGRDEVLDLALGGRDSSIIAAP